MTKLWPPVVLFFLAPAIGELLSGSAPPVEFFSPFGLTVLTVLYGGGAILIREIVIRWRKGWVSLLLLGAAYGIIEEGLMVKSFFDPVWMDIGILGSYGRWAGVNWVWSLELTIYHAVISIAIPILLTELIFQGQRNESWVWRRGFIILAVLFVADIAFGYFLLTPYRPGAVQYWLAVAIVAALILLAWRVPRQPFAEKNVTVKRPVRFWLLGFSATLAFFITFWVLPNTIMPPLVTMLIGIGLIILVIWLVMRLSGNVSAWTDTHRLALACGPLSVFILMTPIHELDTARTDNPSGMMIVGLVTLIFLAWLYWWTNRRLEVTGNE